jgi:hypothetical protein
MDDRGDFTSKYRRRRISMARTFEPVKTCNAVKLKLSLGLLFGFSAAVVASSINWPGPFTVAKLFKSPTSIREIVVVTTPARSRTPAPPVELIGRMVNGSFLEAKNLVETVYLHEYHGNGCIRDGEPTWIDDRLVCAHDSIGIFIADAETNTILFNNVLAGYAKSPTAEQWAAVRFRLTARIQPLLTDDFEDTVLLIDPRRVAAAAAGIQEPDSLAHVQSAKPGGVALAAPEWSPDGSAFAILTWKQGAVEAVRYNSNLREIGRVAVKIQVERETALSLAFKPELAQTAKNILRDLTIFQSIRSR